MTLLREDFVPLDGESQWFIRRGRGNVRAAVASRSDTSSQHPDTLNLHPTFFFWSPGGDTCDNMTSGPMEKRKSPSGLTLVNTFLMHSYWVIQYHTASANDKLVANNAPSFVPD